MGLALMFVLAQETNMALVDPNIAMSYRGIELPNQLAQYGQVQQIQAAQNQNRLADAQMAEYERGRTQKEGLFLPAPIWLAQPPVKGCLDTANPVVKCTNRCSKAKKTRVRRKKQKPILRLLA